MSPFPAPRAAVSAVRHLFLTLSQLFGPRTRRRSGVDTESGMTTAEYAVGTVAAVAFAAVLYQVVRSGAVQSALSTIIQNALGISL